MRKQIGMFNNKVAVILVNYNGIKDTIECIKSLQHSDSYNEIKIIVVDNASKVNQCKEINDQFPDVVTIRSEVNGGFSAGNNIGIKWALENQYGYIMMLNNDTVVAPDMIKFLKQKCDAETVVAPKMLYFSKPDIIWYGGGTINKKTGNAEHYNMNSTDKHDVKSSECTFATGCCIMLKSETINKVGLLNEDYFMYCEDTDYCIRLQKVGIKILYVSSAKLWHKISASTGGDESAFSIYYMTRNRIEVIKKYKDYFDFTALPFTIISRKIRRNQMKKKDNPSWKAFDKGIKDGINGVSGKVDLNSI